MKKTIFSALFALALLATAGWGMSKSMHSSNDNAVLNEMALANVEALADGEIIVDRPCILDCYGCSCHYLPTNGDPRFWTEGRYYY